MSKIVVYTALFGEYDILDDPPKNYEGCDFICFTDLNLSSKIWKIIRVELSNKEPVYANRLYKMFPHIYLAAYEISMYIDANVKIVDNPLKLIKKYLTDSNFAAPIHPIRRSVFSEMIACSSNRKCPPFIAYNQQITYVREGFNDSHGLTANNVLLRRHNSPEVILAMNLWWNEFLSKTKRDQLSLQYCLWKCDVDIVYMNESPWGERNFFSYEPHVQHLKLNIILKFILRFNAFIRLMLYLPLFTLLFKLKIKL